MISISIRLLVLFTVFIVLTTGIHAQIDQKPRFRVFGGMCDVYEEDSESDLMLAAATWGFGIEMTPQISKRLYLKTGLSFVKTGGRQVVIVNDRQGILHSVIQQLDIAALLQYRILQSKQSFFFLGPSLAPTLNHNYKLRVDDIKESYDGLDNFKSIATYMNVGLSARLTSFSSKSIHGELRYRRSIGRITENDTRTELPATAPIFGTNSLSVGLMLVF